MEDMYRAIRMDFLVPLAFYHISSNSTPCIRQIAVLMAGSLVHFPAIHNS